MNLLKALYISAYMTALTLSFFFGLYTLVMLGISIVWVGIVVSTAVQLSFFMRLFLWPTPRTSTSLPLLQIISVIATLVAVGAAVLDKQMGLIVLAIIVGVILPLLYVYWYSSFGTRDKESLKKNHTLPAITLTDKDGRLIPFEELVETRALWMFYRGNWCPLCMAQIREVATQYQALAKRGVRIYLISPQPPEHTADLAKKFDVPLQFYVDVDNQAARRLGILAENGLPTGLQALGYDSDVPMPTVFITEKGGEILYADLTDNYRIRPEPQEFLAELDRIDNVKR